MEIDGFKNQFLSNLENTKKDLSKLEHTLSFKANSKALIELEELIKEEI